MRKRIMTRGLTMLACCGALSTLGCESEQTRQSRLGDVPPPAPAPAAIDLYDSPPANPQTSPPADDVVEPVMIEPAPAPEPQRRHVIARRDTLWSIAERYYGDGKRWQEIARANNISDPAKLVIGEELILP